jgi:hypothetical protein
MTCADREARPRLERKNAVTASVHTLDEIRLVDAGVVAMRSIAALRDVVIEIELGRGNFTDRFRGSAERLLSGAPCVAGEVHCRRCYWVQCTKLFETAEAANRYMREPPEEPDATSDIWDHAELDEARSEPLRHWRSVLGPVPLRHLRLVTSLETIDVVCEDIEVRVGE